MGRLLGFGDAAPWFEARCTANPTYQFNSVGGRYIVLCFFRSAANEIGKVALRGFQDASQVFDDFNAAFFGVSNDPADEAQARVAQSIPGYRFFWDFDAVVSQSFGVDEIPQTFLLDPRLRVIARWPIGENPVEHVSSVLTTLASLPPVEPSSLAKVQAPVLVVPRLFEPNFCRTLIAYYEDRGGEDSGFMREKEGKTVGVIDYSHKRRRDQEIDDETIRNMCMHRIHDRLIPEIEKAFQFRATRMERYIVACYDASEGGHFRAHRDNTTKGTAHRRFAVSLILNTGEFEGGHLRFPEFGSQLYSAPAGGAVVFSCSLLHEATPVTNGRRYVFLPFLYDEPAAKIRQANLKYLG